MSETRSDLSASMIIVLAFVEAKRLKQGNPSWCRKYFVGKARRLLGRQLPENVVPLSQDAEPYFAPQRDAQLALKALCARCGGCPLSKE